MNYAWGIGLHGQKQGGAILPEMMRWLWRDHPHSVDAADKEERAFNAAKNSTDDANANSAKIQPSSEKP